MNGQAGGTGSAVILFGHGARDPEWARPMQRIRAALQQDGGGLPVELAFLEFMTPTLPEAIARLAAEGVGRIAVVPVFLAQGGHLKRDLPALIGQAQALHPECRIVLAEAAGEADGVIAAIADYAKGCLRAM
ncbi:sirohydrochlorin chelatase [Thauera sinica]|uniref:Sirohydrochlorin chelatase n=1 Tax=Thauera sinica TaxID=2665146 RepID=A0ABW1AYD1_9RHOO